MTRRAPPSAAAADRTLARRIVEISADNRPEAFPLGDPGEDLELVMRRRAEDSFQRALCGRIWWRLSRKDRVAIRTKIMAGNSYYATHPASGALEYECIDEIAKMLAQGRRTQPSLAAQPVQPPEIPNARLRKGLREAQRGRGVRTFVSKKKLFQSLRDL